MALSAIAKRRITKLADFMDGLPREADKHFDMDYYLVNIGGTVPRGQITPQRLLESCGTHACAAGWADTLPFFNKLGLRTRGGMVTGINRISKIFHIDQRQSLALFGMSSPARIRVKTPKQWARLARRLMREWAEE